MKNDFTFLNNSFYKRKASKLYYYMIDHLLLPRIAHVNYVQASISTLHDLKEV